MSKDCAPRRLSAETLEAEQTASDIAMPPASPGTERVESVRVLHSLYASASAMMGVVELVDEDVRFIEFNATLAQFLHRPAREIRGRRASELGLDGEALRFWVARYRECQQSDSPLQFERETHWTFPGQKRATLWLCVTISFIGLGPNHKPRFTFLVEDISQHKQTEQSLQQTQTRLRLLTDIAAYATAHRNPDDIIQQVLDRLHTAFPTLRATYFTLASEGILTYEASAGPVSMPALQGKTLSGGPAPDYLAALRRQILFAAETVAEEPRLYALAPALEEMGCAALLDCPLHSIPGRSSGALSLHAPHPHAWSAFERRTLAEVAEQLSLLLHHATLQASLRHADRARRKDNKRIATILDSIHDAYLALDRNWIITYTNGRAEDLLRRPRAQLLGLNFWDAFPIVRTLRLYDELQRAMSKQVSVHFVDYYPFADRWLEHNIYPAQDGLFLYARDVTAQHKAQEELQQGMEKLQRSLHGFVQSMSLAIDIRDPYTAGHQRRVSALAARIAQRLGYEADRVEGIRIAGLLHDIGKIAVPAEILSRPGRLSSAETSLIQAHAQVGYSILKDIEFPAPVALIALQHHERLDGSGYPEGLRGDQILPESRLLAVADVVEAMASHRPYRAALGLPTALEEILQGRNIRYDADVVDACFELFRAYAFDFDHALADDSPPRKEKQ